jgi:sigma-B regulation protein RsbU (phosphoserine phosphatase)
MDREGRYLFDNKAHRRFLGAESIHDVIGKTVFDFFPTEFAEHFRADDQQVLRTGTPLMNREEQITGPDGNTLWVSTTKVPQYNENGTIRGLVVISRDITARKVAHEHVQEVNQRLEADLSLAGETQAALFPSEYPEVSGSGLALHFSDYHQFSQSLGGDYFTVTPLGPGRVGVFICDVMGHGVRSALVAATIHAQFHEVVREDPSPDALLHELNDRLRRLVRRGGDMVFATALYALFDLNRRRLWFALAGHPDPLHVCRQGKQAMILPPPGGNHGTALGLLPDPTYSAGDLPIQPGQSVILYTDGLNESMNPEREMYGSQRIVSIVQDSLEKHGYAMLRQILDDVGSFREGKPADDDVCLLSVDIIPQS